MKAQKVDTSRHKSNIKAKETEKGKETAEDDDNAGPSTGKKLKTLRVV